MRSQYELTKQFYKIQHFNYFSAITQFVNKNEVKSASVTFETVKSYLKNKTIKPLEKEKIGSGCECIIFVGPHTRPIAIKKRFQ